MAAVPTPTPVMVLAAASRQFDLAVPSQLRSLPTDPDNDVQPLVRVQPADICRAIDALLEYITASPADSEAVISWCSTLRDVAESAMSPDQLLLRLDRHRRLVPAYTLFPDDGAAASPVDVAGERLSAPVGDAAGWEVAVSNLRAVVEAMFDLEFALTDGRIDVDVVDAVARIRSAVVWCPDAFYEEEKLRLEDVLSDVECGGDPKYLVARLFDPSLYARWTIAVVNETTAEWISRICAADGFADLVWVRAIPAGEGSPLDTREALFHALDMLLDQTQVQLKLIDTNLHRYRRWSARVRKLAATIAATFDAATVVSPGEAYRGRRLLALIVHGVLRPSLPSAKRIISDPLQFEAARIEANTWISGALALHSDRCRRMAAAGTAGQQTVDGELACYPVDSAPRNRLRSRDHCAGALARLVRAVRTAPPGVGFDEFAAAVLTAARAGTFLTAVERARLEIVVVALAFGDDLAGIPDADAWQQLIVEGPASRITEWSTGRSSVRGARYADSTEFAPLQIQSLSSCGVLTRADLADMLDLLERVPHRARSVPVAIDGVLHTVRHTTALDPDERTRFERAITEVVRQAIPAAGAWCRVVGELD